MSRLPVTPNRDLGQHFLADDNILDVIGRIAELAPDDIVLEVGAGLGALTRYLADRVAIVHAVELDRGLEQHLREALAGRDNVRVVIGDALKLPLAELRPAPRKLVANLPYSIATPLVVESLDGLPTIDSWCVMLQREVADRVVAAPGSKVYGAVSVLVQLTTRRVGFHPVSRTCFQPPPNVDSALVGLERTRAWGTEFAFVKSVVQGAFSHRRKTVANALELAGVAPRPRVVEALETLSVPPGARAESLPPPQFLRLAELLT